MVLSSKDGRKLDEMEGDGMRKWLVLLVRMKRLSSN